MAGARRRSTRTEEQPPLTLGFAGLGELDAKAVNALLDDLIEGREVKTVFLPLTDGDTTDEIVHVQRWCLENEIPYEVVSNDKDVKKDKGLKKILDSAAGDYEAQEHGAAKDIVELLADEDHKDARLLMFLNPQEEADLEVFAHAQENDVDSYDMCDDLSAITEEGDPEPEPEPEPEPPTDINTRRGRGRRAAEPDPEPEPSGDAPEPYTKAEQKEYATYLDTKQTTLVELKKIAKALDPENITTETLRGADREYIADLVIITKRNQAEAGEGDDGEPADEAQNSAPARRGRGRAATSEEPADDAAAGDDAADGKDAVFARLRASRERSELITQNLTEAMRVIVKEGGDPEEVVERAAAALAAGLMLFAEYLIVEVRKPKSAGRPRADGSEAQPKPPADPDAPKRGRGRPRKAVD